VTVPQPGTREHDEFVRRAKNPTSLEAQVLNQMARDAAEQAQNQFRAMLHEMIELVPGQLFRDIERFHAKFGLEPTKDAGHRLPEDLLKFRVKFLFEELFEYCQAIGLLPVQNSHGYEIDNILVLNKALDTEQAFDALIDLVYVALGTAYLHRFPFNDGWDRVQAANMAKVRAERKDQSKRGSAYDVVKPEGWKPPVLADLLDEACNECNGKGRRECISELPEGDDLPCTACNETGRRKRATPKEETA
jgi:predicted HAD superfamily Cof-like phosphohydrolase